MINYNTKLCNLLNKNNSLKIIHTKTSKNIDIIDIYYNKMIKGSFISTIDKKYLYKYIQSFYGIIL